MAWRGTRRAWIAGKSGGNRRALRRLVGGPTPPGILGYLDGAPVAWCAVAPRETYGGLARSRVLRPVDAEPVWSVTCLFIRKDLRRRGLSTAMLDEAVRFAGRRGATLVEGYPIDPRDRLPDPFVWTGTAAAFVAAGFHEVARRSPTRPIMRRRCSRRPRG